MLWFITACIFLLLEHFFPDWYSVVALGLYLPILHFTAGVFKEKSKQTLNQESRDILLPLGVIGLLSFPMNGMPQDYINITCASIALYSLRKCNPLINYRSFSAFVTISILSSIFVWISEGKSWDIFFLGFFLGIIEIPTNTWKLALVYGIQFSIFYYLGLVPIFQWSSIPLPLSFFMFLPIIFAIFTLFFYSIGTKSSLSIFKISSLLVGYYLCFIWERPIFSAILYFSSLQGKPTKENIVGEDS